MFPTRAAVNADDHVMVGTGGGLPVGFTPPQLPPPDPTLGDAMRNRDWAGREQQAYYEMQHAPLPYQFTRDAPHPTFGGGAGNQLTQWLPQGPPAGFAARQPGPTVYALPGMAPHPGRPTR